MFLTNGQSDVRKFGHRGRKRGQAGLYLFRFRGDLFKNTTVRLLKLFGDQHRPHGMSLEAERPFCRRLEHLSCQVDRQAYAVFLGFSQSLIPDRVAAGCVNEVVTS
jgi:hypothetical protein